jgi:hypothetical protein
MQGKILGGITPQQKMVAVNNKFGNTNIKGQQGTTRVLFDSIKLNGQTEFRFFENAGSKRYPFTNVGAEGNRLNVGETFAIQKIYFGYITTNPDTGEFDSFQVGFPFFAKGELSFQIANSQVIKQLPLIDFYQNSFNPSAVNGNDIAFETLTDIVIPPLLEYTLTVRTANQIAAADQHLVCFIEGTAGILAPQTTF